MSFKRGDLVLCIEGYETWAPGGFLFGPFPHPETGKTYNVRGCCEDPLNPRVIRLHLFEFIRPDFGFRAARFIKISGQDLMSVKEDLGLVVA